MVSASLPIARPAPLCRVAPLATVVFEATVPSASPKALLAITKRVPAFTNVLPV